MDNFVEKRVSKSLIRLSDVSAGYTEVVEEGSERANLHDFLGLLLAP